MPKNMRRNCEMYACEILGASAAENDGLYTSKSWILHFKIMDFTLEMMDFTLRIMDVSLRMVDFTLTMIDF